MVDVAQLVRAPDCGSGGRGFKSHLPPLNRRQLRFFFAPFHTHAMPENAAPPQAEWINRLRPYGPAQNYGRRKVRKIIIYLLSACDACIIFKPKIDGITYE